MPQTPMPSGQSIVHPAVADAANEDQGDQEFARKTRHDHSVLPGRARAVVGSLIVVRWSRKENRSCPIGLRMPTAGFQAPDVLVVNGM